MPNALMPSAQTQKAMMPQWGRLLAKAGRGGDTMLAHINRNEAKLLAARGGAWTINPKTGLPEFNVGGGSAEGGRDTAGPGGGGGGDGGGGGSGGAKGDSGEGNALASGPPGVAHGDTSGQSPASNAAGPQGPNAGNTFASGVGSETAVSRNVAQEEGLTPDAALQGARNLSTAVDRSYTSGAFSSLQNFAASLFGIKQNLVNQPFKSYADGLDRPSYGFDPAGLIGGVAGLALGAPGLGAVASLVSDKLGNPLERGLTANPSVGYGPHGAGL